MKNLFVKLVDKIDDGVFSGLVFMFVIGIMMASITGIVGIISLFC